MGGCGIFQEVILSDTLLLDPIWVVTPPSFHTHPSYHIPLLSHTSPITHPSYHTPPPITHTLLSHPPPITHPSYHTHPSITPPLPSGPSCRYAFTILANMTVFVALFVLLKVIGEHEGTGSDSNALNPKDEWLFSVRLLPLFLPRLSPSPSPSPSLLIYSADQSELFHVLNM